VTWRALGGVSGGVLGRRHRSRVHSFPGETLARDCIEQLAAVAYASNAKFFQVLGGNARKDRLIDGVSAERGFVLFETKAAQPSSNVHSRDPPLPVA
jgi:hypothetical protein